MQFTGCHYHLGEPIDADHHGVFCLDSAIQCENITGGALHTIPLAHGTRFTAP